MSRMTIPQLSQAGGKKRKSKNQNTTNHQNRTVTEMIEIISIPLRDIILGSSKPK